MEVRCKWVDLNLFHSYFYFMYQMKYYRCFYELFSDKNHRNWMRLFIYLRHTSTSGVLDKFLFSSRRPISICCGHVHSIKDAEGKRTCSHDRANVSLGRWAIFRPANLRTPWSADGVSNFFFLKKHKQTDTHVTIMKGWISKLNQKMLFETKQT